jgi:hypothetical protein
MLESLILDDPAVMQRDDSTAVARRLCVMGDHQESALVFLLELVKQSEDFPARCGVEIASRFIAQQQGRPENDRARDGHALALASGEFIGTVLRPVF